MTKNIRLTFFILLLIHPGFAQVPGYMGRKLTIGYSNYFMLAGIGPMYNREGGGINTTHCLNLEYTIKNRTNFCLTYQKMKTGVDDHQNFYYNSADQYGNLQSFTYAYGLSVPMQLSCQNFGVGLKFFKHGYLAPAGKYTKLEFLMLFNHLTYDKYGFAGTDNTYPSYTTPPVKAIGTGDYTYRTIAITYSFGRQRILFNRIVLDCGTRIGFVPTGMIALINDESITLINDMSPENLFKYDTFARQLKFQLINFHLGVGFLAF